MLVDTEAGTITGNGVAESLANANISRESNVAQGGMVEQAVSSVAMGKIVNPIAGPIGRGIFSALEMGFAAQTKTGGSIMKDPTGMGRF
jgi:hypothetical protein